MDPKKLPTAAEAARDLAEASPQFSPGVHAAAAAFAAAVVVELAELRGRLDAWQPVSEPAEGTDATTA